jgi:hypothetical protein
LVLCAAGVWCWYAVTNAVERFESVSSNMAEHIDDLKRRTQVITHQYQSASGLVIVTTTQRDNETYAQMLDRHDDELADAKARWPQT